MKVQLILIVKKLLNPQHIGLKGKIQEENNGDSGISLQNLHCELIVTAVECLPVNHDPNCHADQ